MQRFIVATTLAVFAVAGAPLPASAQDSGEKINQLIVYGDDPCPPSSGDEITVCARKAEAERFRIPEPLRASPSPQNDAWSNRVVAYEAVGRTGTLSCSPTGPGGSTGCLQQLIDRSYAEKGSDPGVRFGELIAAEREKRLATIDADAAATQARVEQAEREIAERLRREQDAPMPAPPPAPGN